MRVRTVKRSIKGFYFILFGLVAVAVGIIALSFAEEDMDLLYLLSTVERNSENMDVWEETLEEFTDLGDSEDQDSVSQESGMTGVGLNLNLINNIATNGYVKELLELAAESQKGTLSLSEPLVPIELRTVLGIWRTEVDVYAGTPILRSYLPWDKSSNSPVWNTPAYGLTSSQMTLKGCGESEVRVLQSNGALTSGMIGAAVGPLQFEPGNSSLIASKYVPTTGDLDSARTSTDVYYTPDQIVSLTTYLQNGCNFAGISDELIKEMSQDTIAIATAIAHNRGAGAVLNNMLGCYFGSGKKCVADSDPANVIKSLEETANDIAYGVSGVSDYEALNILGKDDFVFPFIVLMKSGWKIDSVAKDWIMGKSEDGIAAWNLLHAADSISTADELEGRISPCVSSLPKETGYSIAECAAIYGVNADGSFKQFPSWSHARGYVFKVTERTSGAYGLYAVMLKYAGVDVDVTNPETFFNSMAENNEWTGDIAQSLDILALLGVDITQLTDLRASVLDAAYRLLGIQYHQCRGSGCNMGKSGDPFQCDGHCYNSEGIPTHIDCSSYVWRAYFDTGFDMTGFPTSTSSYATSACVREITFGEIQPGDLIWRSGHVMLYVGRVGDSIHYMHATSHGVPSCIATMSVEKAIQSRYKYYRHASAD